MAAKWRSNWTRTRLHATVLSSWGDRYAICGASMCYKHTTNRDTFLNTRLRDSQSETLHWLDPVIFQSHLMSNGVPAQGTPMRRIFANVLKSYVSLPSNVMVYS